jgi:hypothetical protein
MTFPGLIEGLDEVVADAEFGRDAGEPSSSALARWLL